MTPREKERHDGWSSGWPPNMVTRLDLKVKSNSPTRIRHDGWTAGWPCTKAPHPKALERQWKEDKLSARELNRVINSSDGQLVLTPMKRRRNYSILPSATNTGLQRGSPNNIGAHAPLTPRFDDGDGNSGAVGSSEAAAAGGARAAARLGLVLDSEAAAEELLAAAAEVTFAGDSSVPEPVAASGGGLFGPDSTRAVAAALAMGMHVAYLCAFSNLWTAVNGLCGSAALLRHTVSHPQVPWLLRTWPGALGTRLGLGTMELLCAAGVGLSGLGIVAPSGYGRSGMALGSSWWLYRSLHAAALPALLASDSVGRGGSQLLLRSGLLAILALPPFGGWLLRWEHRIESDGLLRAVRELEWLTSAVGMTAVRWLVLRVVMDEFSSWCQVASAIEVASGKLGAALTALLQLVPTTGFSVLGPTLTLPLLLLPQSSSSSGSGHKQLSSPRSRSSSMLSPDTRLAVSADTGVQCSLLRCGQILRWAMSATAFGSVLGAAVLATTSSSVSGQRQAATLAASAWQGWLRVARTAAGVVVGLDLATHGGAIGRSVRRAMQLAVTDSAADRDSPRSGGSGGSGRSLLSSQEQLSPLSRLQGQTGAVVALAGTGLDESLDERKGRHDGWIAGWPEPPPSPKHTQSGGDHVAFAALHSIAVLCATVVTFTVSLRAILKPSNAVALSATTTFTTTAASQFVTGPSLPFPRAMNVSLRQRSSPAFWWLRRLLPGGPWFVWLAVCVPVAVKLVAIPAFKGYQAYTALQRQNQQQHQLLLTAAHAVSSLSRFRTSGYYEGDTGSDDGEGSTGRHRSDDGIAGRLSRPPSFIAALDTLDEACEEDEQSVAGPSSPRPPLSPTSPLHGRARQSAASATTTPPMPPTLSTPPTLMVQQQQEPRPTIFYDGTKYVTLPPKPPPKGLIWRVHGEVN